MSDNHHLPLENEDGQFISPKDTSAGLGSITSSLGQVLKYMKPGDAFKTMRKLNQKGGFDCPGCAWPDPDDERSKLGEFCENGIKAIAEEASRKTLNAAFFKSNNIDKISKLSDFEIGKLGRIDQPYYKSAESRNYVPIEWSNAYKLITHKLKALTDPNEAIFYTSGRTSNEAAFLYQLMVRKFGTNNLPDCSNMCHEASGKGLSQTVGIGKGSVTLEDLHQAEVILVIGQNPGTNHPRMLSALEKCKENGGKIISINPIKEAGLLKFKHPQKVGRIIGRGRTLSDLYLQVRINGDIGLLKGTMKLLLQKEEENGGILDLDFINEKTSGWSTFKAGLAETSLDQCVATSGITLQEMNEVVEILSRSTKIIACWAMGLTQHLNGVQNIREVVNLLLMKGAIGKPGAGTCPVRGHSNVQGDRTMGIWEAPPESFLRKLEEKFSFNAPRKHGFAVVDAIKALHNQSASLLFCMGGNLLSASPDTNYTAEAIGNASLVISVSTKLNRTHLVARGGALILPCKGRTEIDLQESGQQFVTVENSMGVVHRSQGVLPICSENIKSEVEIICEISSSLFETEKAMWTSFKDDYSQIRDAISEVIPGFENYNDKVANDSGFYLPNGARKGSFRTSDDKAQFTFNPIPTSDLKDDEFILMTIRSHDQFNTTIYGNNDRYRGIKNMRRIVMMNKEDMDHWEIKAMQKVDLISNYEGQERNVSAFKVIPYDIPRGNLAAYFPEINPLVHIDSHDSSSKTPASKYIVVRIVK